MLEEEAKGKKEEEREKEGGEEQEERVEGGDVEEGGQEKHREHFSWYIKSKLSCSTVAVLMRT